MADRRVPLAAVDFPDMRLGRHVNHDPRSLRFLVAPPTARATPRTVRHERHVPPFNQGDLGSCTVNATLGALATGPYWATLSADLQRQLRSPGIQTDLVQPLYRDTTRTDPFQGAWEPDDTGSDGLSIAKVVTGRGWISGYQHITSLAACHVAIQNGPFITGTMWFNGMFYPDSDGVVRVSGAAAGGHEYVCDGYELERDLWWFTNSWGPSWGRNGTFAMTSATFQDLLARQGDATSFVPVTAPPPVPEGPDLPADDFPYTKLDAWAASRKSWWTKVQRDAADAYTTWRNDHR